jgi:hypothetical protein
MSNYTQTTNFATKDALASGNPLKVVKGTEINVEFGNIATAVATKADSASPTFTGTVTIPILSYAGTTLSAAVTGTGKMVLDTSPTLITPVLGTPTSGVLTNCTGINYNGLKNRIINGQMQVAQRATSATITAGSTIALGYSTVDRFYVYCTGANVTAAQVAGSGATKNRLQITGAASVTAVGIGQRIEQLNSYDLAGSTATLSADLAISATLTTVTWTASYATTTADTFGTLASPTVTQIATGTFTVTSTVTNFSTNITIPAAATTGIQIVFTVGALTAGLTWTVGNVQLEKGATATSFDYRPYGTELALCQRYFEKSYVSATAPATATEVGVAYSIVGNSAGNAASNVFFRVSKRTTPTELAIYSPVTGTASRVRNSTAGTDEVSAAYGTGENSFAVLGSTTTNTTCFRFQWTAGSEL